MNQSQFSDLRSTISGLMEQIHTQDHARNEKAIAMRKEIHIKLIDNRASYQEAYTILRDVIKENVEFFSSMCRVRDTILAHEEGRTADAYAMIEEHYKELGLVVA